MDIYKLCQKNSIHLSVITVISRDNNEQADALSRAEDANDYSLDPLVLQQLDGKWGARTVDRFASVHTKQLSRYCSQFLNPGCEAVDAFTVRWGRENNWVFPLPYLIPRVLQHVMLFVMTMDNKLTRIVNLLLKHLFLCLYLYNTT